MPTIPLKQCKAPGCSHEFPEHYLHDVCPDCRHTPEGQEDDKFVQSLIADVKKRRQQHASV